MTNNAPNPTGDDRMSKPKPRQTPLTEPLQRFAGHKVMRLLGFWVLVQNYGSW